MPASAIGEGFTVIITEELAVQPFISVPTNIYVVVAVGVTTGERVLFTFIGVQLYVYVTGVGLLKVIVQSKRVPVSPVYESPTNNDQVPFGVAQAARVAQTLAPSYGT